MFNKRQKINVTVKVHKVISNNVMNVKKGLIYT